LACSVEGERLAIGLPYLATLAWTPDFPRLLAEEGTGMLEYLGRYQIEIVICECVLPDGNWRDLLSIMAPLAESPRLIVISAHADDLLWAEVLNLGGYDVLAKPLKLQEVARTVALAWRNWKDEWEKSKTPVAPTFLMRISAAP
jgi:DNA-binding response OmpR family regulator